MIEQEVKAYCRANGIPEEGVVTRDQAHQLEHFLDKIRRRERIKTRLKEESTKSQIGMCLRSLVNHMAGSIIHSPIEEFLWEELKRVGLTDKAETQYPIGPYKIDIAYPYKRLAVECDGQEYHKDQRWQLDRDQKRDRYLARKGWLTLRLSGKLIRNNINHCVDLIREKL